MGVDLSEWQAWCSADHPAAIRKLIQVVVRNRRGIYMTSAAKIAHARSLEAMVAKCAKESAFIFRVTLPRCAFTVISLISSSVPTNRRSLSAPFQVVVKNRAGTAKHVPSMQALEREIPGISAQLTVSSNFRAAACTCERSGSRHFPEADRARH
jgi:hypothetical protein